MICCLLFQASLPTIYWADALHTATHLNRLPSKAVSHPTPHFALYSTTPSYDHLSMFGCACYPNTSATAPHKLSPRSTCCLFLGYSPDHKGYRCLDLASHCIIISRHVVFDEDEFPLASSSPPTDLNSLLEFDLVPPPQAPRFASLPAPHVASTPPLAPLPAPRAASSTQPAPRAAPSTTPARCAALSTSAARIVDFALVYRRHGHGSTPLPRCPLTRAHQRAQLALLNLSSSITVVSRPCPQPSTSHSEPPVYHSVAIHRDPGHVHPMVTRRVTAFSAPSTG
jgi:hypothetical protein